MDLRAQLFDNALFEGNLWLLTPEAFLHYLPALMDIALTKYRSTSVFASELIGALTKPSRGDVEASLDRLEQLPPGLTLSSPPIADALRRQQLEWFDSGTPSAVFEERFGDLTEAERAAVVAFLEASVTSTGRTSRSASSTPRSSASGPADRQGRGGGRRRPFLASNSFDRTR